MSSIFLSHSHADKAFVNTLAEQLRRHGIRVWVDDAEIQVGDSLLEKIELAIDEMDYLGVALTPESVSSEWVRREVEIALNEEIRSKRVKVLPLLCKSCRIPGFLKGKLYADLTAKAKHEKALGKLLTRLGVQGTSGGMNPPDAEGEHTAGSSQAAVPLRAFIRGDYRTIGELLFPDSLLLKFVRQVYFAGRHVCADMEVPSELWESYQVGIYEEYKVEVGEGPSFEPDWGGCWVEVYFSRRGKTRGEIREVCERIIRQHTAELLSIAPDLMEWC